MNGKRYEPLHLVSRTAPDVREALDRVRRGELVEFVFSMVAFGTVGVLLAIFTSGNALHFGAGLLAALGGSALIDGVTQFRFWRHHAKCTRCRSRHEQQFAEHLYPSCDPA